MIKLFITSLNTIHNKRCYKKPKAIIEKLNLKPNTLGPKGWWLH